MKNLFKNKMLKKTLLSLSLAIMMIGGVFVLSTPAKAAADIAISSATITSSNTVVVSFTNPGDRLWVTSYTKWHIDQTTGGVSPLLLVTKVHGQLP